MERESEATLIGKTVVFLEKHGRVMVGDIVKADISKNIFEIKPRFYESTRLLSRRDFYTSRPALLHELRKRISAQLDEIDGFKRLVPGQSAAEKLAFFTVIVSGAQSQFENNVKGADRTLDVFMQIIMDHFAQNSVKMREAVCKMIAINLLGGKEEEAFGYIGKIAPTYLTIDHDKYFPPTK